MWTSCTKYFTNFLIGNASFISFQNFWIYSRSKLWKKMTEINGISGSRFGENTLWTHNLHLSDSTVGRLPWLQHERTCNTKKKSRNKQTSNLFYEKNMSSARHHIFWYLGKAKRTSQQTVNWFYEQNKSSARQWRHHNFWHYIPLTSIS